MQAKQFTITRTFVWTFAVLASATSLSACKGDDTAADDDTTASGTDTSTTGAETGSEQQVVFWQDVAPLYYESCVTCHRAGGIGPFALDNYASASSWAQASAMAVDNRVMPPWLVVDDGSCGEWANSRALSDEAIETILAWVDAGTPEGTPRDDLSLPELPGLEDSVTFQTPEFTPEPEGGMFSKFDEYRCFMFDPEFDTDKFITAYEVKPGNEALVHHALLMPVDPDTIVGGGQTNLQVLEALDAQSPDRLGWPCFGAAGDGVDVSGIPVSWAPGQGVVELPDNSGSRVGANELLVVQIHYNMADAAIIGQSDTTAVNLQLVDQVEHEGFFDLPDSLLDSLFSGNPVMLPAGETAYEYVFEVSADNYIYPGNSSTALWGFFPHMHAYGSKMSVRVLDAEGQEVDCVGEVPRWDFDWQLYYFYEQPLMLESGQRLEITCTYDTTDATEPVAPGWGTYNEMCLSGIYVVP